jgi:hypothetical protein
VRGRLAQHSTCTPTPTHLFILDVEQVQTAVPYRHMHIDHAGVDEGSLSMEEAAAVPGVVLLCFLWHIPSQQEAKRNIQGEKCCSMTSHSTYHDDLCNSTPPRGQA